MIEKISHEDALCIYLIPLSVKPLPARIKAKSMVTSRIIYDIIPRYNQPV
jgi:hypothetical protein